MELEPSHYDERGRALGWNTGHKGDSTSTGAYALRELVGSMLARNSVLNIYSFHNSTFIPMEVDTQGFRYLAQETGALDRCV